MTPKEKAKELVDKFRTYIRMADKYDYNLSQDEIYLAKQCALIAVDEILIAITFNTYDEEEYIKEDTFWNDVKQEIEKL